MAQTATKKTAEKINYCGYRRGKQPERKPETKVTYRFVAYIPHHKKEEYAALGWRITDDLQGTHHGDWSVLGTYTSERDEEPPVPNDGRVVA